MEVKPEPLAGNLDCASTGEIADAVATSGSRSKHEAQTELDIALAAADARGDLPELRVGDVADGKT